MSDTTYVDEIFAGLLIDRGIDTELLEAQLQDRFVTPFYPARGTIGRRVFSIPPDFPQFKGKRSKKNEIWFERIYLEQEQGARVHMEIRPMGAWLYIEKHYTDDEIEETTGIPAQDLVSCRPFPDHILVTSIERIGNSEYPLSKVAITQPEMVPMPSKSIAHKSSAKGDVQPALIDEEGRHYATLEEFISTTHIETEPWASQGRYWRRDGIQIEACEVAHIDLELHHTPGVAPPLSVISIDTPYDAEKVSMIGPAPRTFFDRKTSKWKIPLPMRPILAGMILSIYSVIILPDGRFFRSKV